MKFNEFKYERCDIVGVKKEIQKHLTDLNFAKDYQTFKNAFDSIEKINSHLDTMYSLCNVRYTINTEDAYYAKENDFWDENLPHIQAILTKVNHAVLNSAYVDDLKKDVSETYFLIAEYAMRSFDEKIIEDLQEENRLCSAYQKMKASAQIPFDDKVYTLASLASKMSDQNRDVRKRALEAYWGWMGEHEDMFDALYDQLVRVRDRMAKKLGFKNYIELGYLRMNRFDYNEKDVAAYRKQVRKDVVPVATMLYEKQKERLGLDVLRCYDEQYEFASGNPTPKHSKDEMIKIANRMYHDLSKETGVFFDFMVSHDLMDLESKKGKAGGGYCTLFPDYKAPFIFANFNGTNGDVDVLTHEAGHAFQVYTARDIRPIACIWPTMESCEIHSMSMEFFAYPWMKYFFEEDTQKYYYLHLGSAIKFIPYGVLVDHFQHGIYENVDMTIEERKQLWRDLEKEYLPHKNYEDNEMLEKGCFWYKQSHIFESPFYYIDYTLAQVCALQFWKRLYDKDVNAFKDYYEICKIGGTMTFTQIVKKANLKLPFEEGCLEEVMKIAREYLEEIDDQNL